MGFLCGVAGVWINSQLVTPEDYGRYGVFLTFTPLGMWVIHAGLVKLLQRHWAAHADKPALWQTVAQSARRRLPWLALASIAAALLLGVRGWLVAAPLIFVAAAALSYATLATVALQAERRHWEDLCASVGGSATRTFLPPLGYFLSGGMLGALYAGFAFHAVVFAALALFLLRPRSGRSEAPTPAPGAIFTTFTGPMFSVLAVAGWALTGLNRWLAAFFFGASTTGYFTLASNIAFIVPAMLGTLFMQYYLPELVAAPQRTVDERRGLAARFDRIALGFWLMALAAVAVVRLVLPALIGTLVDPQYGAALDFVVPVGCFFAALTTGSFYQQLLIVGHRERDCGPVELSFAAVLGIGGLFAAIAGVEVFRFWLLATALVPWLVLRPLARRAFFAVRAPPSTPSQP